MLVLSSVVNGNYDSTDVLFYYQNQKFLYQDFLDLSCCSENILAKLHKKNVVIMGESRIHSAILPLMLDGIVQSILFLPKDIDRGLYSRYLSEIGADYRVWLTEKKLCYERISVNKNQSFTLNSGSTKWIIPTSGTTRHPRLIAHNLESLTRTTKTNVKIGSSLVWGLVYDINRFAGLQVYLQALIGGSTLVISESDDSIVDVASLLNRFGCNALSATPSFWRKLSMCSSIVDLPLKVISLGGEIADDNILNYLKVNFPDARITHIYASTEAGVGFSVNDGRAGFPLSYLNDQRLGLEIDNDTLIINLPNGIRINTGDIVSIQNDRVFFLGRNSGCINVGGNKVIPEEVEKVILELDFVRETRVYPKSSGFLGSLVVADVVLSPNPLMSDLEIKNEITKHCREKLESFKVPARINIVEDIAITASGKIKRLI